MKLYLFIAITILYFVVVFYFRKHKAWLSYYLLGSFGFTLIAVLAIRQFGLETYWEKMHLIQTHFVSTLLGIKAQVSGFDTIVVPDPIGLVSLKIGIECSGILESVILIGLILFYPTYKSGRKVSLIIFGLIITLVTNIVRILIIIFMTHFLGRSAVFFAHAIVGRLFFFACVIALFWYIITRPTIEEVGRKLSIT